MDHPHCQETRQQPDSARQWSPTVLTVPTVLSADSGPDSLTVPPDSTRQSGTVPDRSDSSDSQGSGRFMARKEF